MSPGRSIRWPRKLDRATSNRPSGSTPTARAAARAASALRRMWALIRPRPPAPITTSSRPSGSSSTSPPGPKVTVVTSSRRWASRSVSPAGTIAVPPGRRPATSSALAAAIASIDPMSSRCTGATAVMRPTSGSAMAVSSAICPGPRIPISSTSASVPAGASSTVMGSPISVLRFSRLATVRRRWLSIAARMSFVEVFPTEPVTPTTGQPRARRHAVARRCRAVSGSSETMTAPDPSAPAPACSDATSAPHAPPASACAAKPPPSTFSPTSPTKRSPGPAARESITARTGPPGNMTGAASRPPAACATSSGDHSRTQGLPRDGHVVEGHGPDVLELLIALVALAGDDDHVARLGQRDRALDGLVAVDDALGLRRPLSDLGHDRLGILVARVVRRDDRDVGVLGGRAPHQGPLATVAIAAGAEDDDQPAARQPAGRAQDRLQGVGLVGVVDEDREGLALVDRLEAAGDALGRRQAARDGRFVDAQLARDHHRAQRVEHVEAARQRRAQCQPVDREGRPARIALDRGRADLRVPRVEADADGLREVAGQARAVGVVDVDHRELGPGLEEAALGQEVVLHVGVEVEVVLREVGE